MTTNATKKHKAILDIKITVYEVNDNGECTYIVPQSELSNFDLKPRVTVGIDGFDRSDCLNKTKVKINEIRKN